MGDDIAGDAGAGDVELHPLPPPDHPGFPRAWCLRHIAALQAENEAMGTMVQVLQVRQEGSMLSPRS